VSTLRQQLEKVDEHNAALAVRAHEAGVLLLSAQGAESKALSRADALKGMLEAMRKKSRLQQQSASHSAIAAQLPGLPPRGTGGRVVARGRQPPPLQLCLQLRREVPLSGKVEALLSRLEKHVGALLEERDALTQREAALVGMLVRDGDVRR
jgi:hypothetical protein